MIEELVYNTLLTDENQELRMKVKKLEREIEQLREELHDARNPQPKRYYNDWDYWD